MEELPIPGLTPVPDTSASASEDLSLIHICGKRALRKEIIALFPQDGVGRYIEVFFGAGWVFFGREKQPGQLEVINDRDGQIVNLFRCIKYHRACLLYTSRCV